MNGLCERCGEEKCGHGYCLRCEGCEHHAPLAPDAERER